MTKTAVEWLENELADKLKLIVLNNDFRMMEGLFEQAKAMEKEQIIDAHIEGQRVFDDYKHTQWTTDQSEHYYNETFK